MAFMKKNAIILPRKKSREECYNTAQEEIERKTCPKMNVNDLNFFQQTI